MEFKLIKPIDVLELRQKILRPGRPLETCIFENDEKSTTNHFGIFIDEKLIAIATVIKSNYDQTEDKQNVFQLRGMAVDDNHQGKNIGRILIENIHHYYSETFHNFYIWCNARKSAENFYRKLGYQTKGSYFEISDVGSHIIMFYTTK